jgi:hypothetical protein
MHLRGQPAHPFVPGRSPSGEEGPRSRRRSIGCLGRQWTCCEPGARHSATALATQQGSFLLWSDSKRGKPTPSRRSPIQTGVPGSRTKPVLTVEGRPGESDEDQVFAREASQVFATKKEPPRGLVRRNGTFGVGSVRSPCRARARSGGARHSRWHQPICFQNVGVADAPAVWYFYPIMHMSAYV